MTSSISQFDAFLKYNYGKSDRIQKLIYPDNAFLAYIKKTGGAGGKKLIAPVQYSGGQGISSSYSGAQTISAASGGNLAAEDWVVDWGDYFASIIISDKVLALSKKGDMAAYLDAQKVEFDSLHKQFAFNLSGYLLRSRARNLGTFTESTGVCTLTTSADDIVHYSVGMQLQASANAGTATSDALLGSGSIGYVIAVNANAGTFTVSASDGGAAGTPSGWQGTMYAFRLGDFGGTTTPNRVVDGFDDWCPSSDPGATVFNNINRTKNVEVLSGIRLTSAEIAGQGIEYRIKRLSTRMASRGYGAPEACFLSPEKWQDLADSLEARGIREIGKDATFGYRSLQLATGGSTVEVFTDRCVPTNAIYMLSKDAFELQYPQANIISPLNGDGLTMLRKGTTNAYEYNLTLYPATIAIPAKLGRTVAP